MNVNVRVRACVRACVCVRACACVRAYMCVHVHVRVGVGTFVNVRFNKIVLSLIDKIHVTLLYIALRFVHRANCKSGFYSEL